MTALDTNVIIDLEDGSEEVAEAAMNAIESAGQQGRIAVCGVVYAELCARPSRRATEVQAALTSAQIAIEAAIPIDVWTAAGIAYGEYARRRKASGGGTTRRILADFIIGAHACTVGALVTNDAAFYRRAFPDLKVIEPRAKA